MLENQTFAREPDVKEDWLRMLDESSVACVVLDRHSDGELLELLRSQTAWISDFEDSQAVIFVHVDRACA